MQARNICLMGGRMLRIIILMMFCATISFCKPVSEEVEFSVPATWHKMKDTPDIITDTVCAYAYYIRTEEINGNNYFANALLLYYVVPDSTKIERADEIVGCLVGNARYIISAADGKNGERIQSNI